jgi:hypothetical protein
VGVDVVDMDVVVVIDVGVGVDVREPASVVSS